jgi:hypothetical protein
LRVLPAIETWKGDDAMTDEDRKNFQAGLNEPLDKIIDIPVDRFTRMTGVRDNYRLKVIPTTDAYRENYDRIFGGPMIMQDKG